MDDHNPEFPLLLLPRRDPDSYHQPSPFRIPSPALATLLSLNTLYILLGPLACAAICLSGILEGQGNSRNMLGVTAWVFLWWLTGAVPVPITALAPMYLFPTFGIAAADDVARSYMSDVIGLLLGSFILAIAIEHYNIHQRLALNITVLFCGDPARPALLLLGICATTAFVSFWMQNTAAAAMMMPVAMGVLQRLPEPEDVLGSAHGEVIDRFGRAVVLGVTYASAIGGMATLTGAAVNLVTVGMWSKYFPDSEPISFSAWFVFGFPTAVAMFLALWGILCFVYLRKGSGTGVNAASPGRVLGQYLDRAHLKRELDLLGPMAFAEKMVLSVFGGLVVLWMTRKITDDVPGWGSLFKLNVGDGTVTIMMASLLFVIPNGKEAGEKLMDWNKCKKLQWNVILLLGGGLAIADGVRTSGLADLLSTSLGFLHDVPYLAVAPIVCLISSGITEFISNNATATLVMPILIELAKNVGMHPLMLMLPGAIGAEFAYLLPIGTPSNIVGYATGRIGMKDMFKVGFPLKLVGIAVVAALTPTLGVLAFGINHHKF